MTTLAKAFKFAKRAHAHQVDSAGAPYIDHVREVIELTLRQGGDETALIVAALHGTVAKAGITLHEIADQFGERVAAAVDVLTKRPTVTTGDYLERILEDPLARIVKIADLAHDMDISRFGRIEKKHHDMAERYRQSLEYLLQTDPLSPPLEPELSPSPEALVASNDWVKKVIHCARGYCKPRYLFVLCDHVFSEQTLTDLARKFWVSQSFIRQMLRGARRAICRANWDLGDNKWKSPTTHWIYRQHETPQPEKDEMRYYRKSMKKRKKRAAPAMPDPDDMNFSSATYASSSSDSAEGSPRREPMPPVPEPKGSDSSSTLAKCLRLAFIVIGVPSLILGLLQWSLSPDIRGLTFQNVIVLANDSREYPGRIQTTLTVASPAGDAVIELSRIKSIKTRPGKFVDRHFRDVNDSLQVQITFHNLGHLDGLINRWVAFSYKGSFKKVDLRALQRVLSDTGDVVGFFDEAVDFSLEHYPPLVHLPASAINTPEEIPGDGWKQ